MKSLLGEFPMACVRHRVTEAAKDAQIYEALRVLPQQFDTFVGLGGAWWEDGRTMVEPRYHGITIV